MPGKTYPRFRNTLPPAVVVAGGAAAFAAALLAVAPVTPFRILPMTVVRVVAGAAFLAALGFRTTVPALPSLVSLVSLRRRPVRVAGREAGTLDPVAVAGRRVFAAAVAPFDVELASEVVVTFLVPLVRVALALSTMLDRTLVAAAREAVVDFKGDPGRGICGFVGDAGRSRFPMRELDEVGDNTWFGLTRPVSARALFFAPSKFSISFSLSPAISLLRKLLACCILFWIAPTLTSCAYNYGLQPECAQAKFSVGWCEACPLLGLEEV